MLLKTLCYYAYISEQVIEAQVPLPTIALIKKRRALAGLTQKQLADLCGLSQSAIAKLESGGVDPSYSTATKILEALERLESRATDGYSFQRHNADEIMTRNIISVKSSDPLSKAQKLLTDERHISQFPVLDATGKPVGSLAETQALHSQSEKTLVEDVMGEAFPVVYQKTKTSTIRSILLEEPAVLVSDGKAGLAGIITKYDLIKIILQGVK